MGFEDVSDCLQIPTVAPRGKIWHSPGVLIPRHPPYLPSDCTSNGWWAVRPEDLSWWRSCRPWWRRHSGANCKTRMFWTQHMWRGSSCCDRYGFRASFPLPVFLNSSQSMWWLSLSLPRATSAVCRIWSPQCTPTYGLVLPSIEHNWALTQKRWMWLSNACWGKCAHTWLRVRHTLPILCPCFSTPDLWLLDPITKLWQTKKKKKMLSHWFLR